MSTDDVAAQLWAPPAPADRIVDVAQLGPAPRPFDSRMDQYLRRTVTTRAPLWLIFAVLFAMGNALTFSTTGRLQVPFFTLLFGGLAAWSFRRRAQERARVRAVLQHGKLVRAVLTNLRVVERRVRGRHVYNDYYSTFQLPHGTVRHKTRDDAMSLLQIGISEEVLWTPQDPDLVVPAYLLA